MKNYLPGDLIKIDSKNFILYQKLTSIGIPYDTYDIFLNDSKSSLSFVISTIELNSAWVKVYYVLTIYGPMYLFEVKTEQ